VIEDIRNERITKAARLRESGIDPYPSKGPKTISIRDARERFATLAKKKTKVTVAGRVLAIRDQGAVLFIDLGSPDEKIQIVAKKEAKDFALLKQSVDRGDIIAVTGIPFETKRGEQSLELKKASLLTKSIRPIPTEWYGISDEEILLRKRYLDLLAHPEIKELFVKKARFWNSIRDTLHGAEFLEVETSSFEAVPGGADAEPFVTHHNALDEDFYLRISLELPLKKLIVGGYDKVYEIGRVFRNEGIDKEHLQDYTALEFYWSYADYQDLIPFVQKLYQNAVKATTGSLTTTYNGEKIKWGGRWPILDYRTAFKKENGFDPIEADIAALRARAKAVGADPQGVVGKGRLIDLIYKKTVRPKIIQPTLLVNHPVLISPLAKRSPKDPQIVERIQVLACGSELGNGWSELNDPIDQRARFEDQMKLRAEGDKEAQMLDEDFIEALEYGMPPTAGFGLSERVFSIFMDKPIRETTIFPMMRREK
jgi:lysyl-tRNA synthetase class 2